MRAEVEKCRGRKPVERLWIAIQINLLSILIFILSLSGFVYAIVGNTVFIKYGKFLQEQPLSYELCCYYGNQNLLPSDMASYSKEYR